MPKLVSIRPTYKILTSNYLSRTLLFFASYADFSFKNYTFEAHLFNIKEEMLDLKQLTGDVCRIATEAGHFLKEERKYFRRESVVEKHAHDYVSYVDKESEVRIVKALSALLPEAGFITEEGSATYQDEPYCWVIDPLDGTTNYIHDEAPYSV